MVRLEHIETFKPSFTNEEVAEIIAWFEERMDRLPESLQMLNCMSAPNLKRTVASYIALLREQRRTVVFAGYVSQLFLIREALRRDHPELEK